jgi:hypothetical protein
MADPKQVRKRRNSAAGTGIVPRKSPHVPAQALGYFIQPIRLLQILLDAPADSFVTLEVFEDVGLETSSGQKIASQVKSGIVKNPLTDKSPELWKTLANWCDAIESGELNQENTIFEIYVAKPRTGKIATLFSDAKSQDEARNALREARKLFSKESSGKRPSGTVTEAESYANRVMGLEKSALTLLIQRFRIATAVRNPLADLRSTVASKWVRPESVEVVIQHAHGWIKEKLDGLLLAGKPACISVNEFNHEMMSFLPRCDFRTIVSSMAGLPSADEVAEQRIRTYVRQLEIIAVHEEDVLHAINEYLRASVTRTKLAEEGIVHRDSFTEYVEALTTFWRNKKNQNALTHTGRSSEDLGRLLLSDCSLRQQKLQGLEMPPYFTPGSYHALADEETIGWHPEYKIRLKAATT